MNSITQIIPTIPNKNFTIVGYNGERTVCGAKQKNSLDEIDIQLYKECFDHIGDPLLHEANTSLLEGKVSCKVN